MSIVGGLLASTSVADDSDAKHEMQFRTQVLPLLQRYCFDCHGNGSSEGFKTARSVFEGRKTWFKVLQKLTVEGMPPEDAEQPSKAEREFLVKWTNNSLHQIDCVREARPGV